MHFKFDLSQGLFSSESVDFGTRLLLAVFSRVLDGDAAAGRAPPCRVLDAGCGTGVIGICAASALIALSALPDAVYVRCQDRDDLARLVTLHNAAKNRISPLVLEAYTEPLLAGPADGRWDLILSNVPAKAGGPVLGDFVRRSACLLNPGGRVIIVVVQALADFFRGIIAADAELVLEKKGPGHSVFVYGGKAAGAFPPAEPVSAGPGFFSRYPFYVRSAVTCPIEEMPIRLETVQGASGYDAPGGAVLAAAKLARRIGLQKLIPGDAVLLVHEGGQGFFPAWLLGLLAGAPGDSKMLVASGRNILALEASRHNSAADIVTAVDLQLGRAALLEAAGGKFAFIAAFPELLPQSTLPKGADQLDFLWEALPPLLARGGLFLAAFSSSEAERFDRKKPAGAGFFRLGSIKRNGFRALAYQLLPVIPARTFPAGPVHCLVDPELTPV